MRQDKKLSLIFTPTPPLSCLWLFSPFPSLASYHSRSQTLPVSLLPSLYLCPTTHPTTKQKKEKSKDLSVGENKRARRTQSVEKIDERGIKRGKNAVSSDLKGSIVLLLPWWLKAKIRERLIAEHILHGRIFSHLQPLLVIMHPITLAWSTATLQMPFRRDSSARPILHYAGGYSWLFWILFHII